jgi:hypothetical protein
VTVKPNRLAGHALQHEGRIKDAYGYPQKVGPAVCTCGVRSEVLTSDNARRVWHRDVHKPAVREQEA